MTEVPKRAVVTLKSGERVALPEGEPIKTGDRVLVIPTSDGKFITTGNNPIEKDNKVIVLTTNANEKVSVYVNVPYIPACPSGTYPSIVDGKWSCIPIPPSPPILICPSGTYPSIIDGTCYCIPIPIIPLTPTIDCSSDDNVTVSLVDVDNLILTNKPFTITQTIPPCCDMKVIITQYVKVFMYPNPLYGGPGGLLQPPYQASYFDPTVSNLDMGLAGAVDSGVFVMYAHPGIFTVQYNNEEPTNIELNPYNWGACPSTIPGSKNICFVPNTTEEINGLYYGEFTDYITSRKDSSFRKSITNNSELKDGGNTITIHGIDLGYCDTTKVQIQLTISREEYKANRSKYQLLG